MGDLPKKSCRKSKKSRKGKKAKAVPERGVESWAEECEDLKDPLLSRLYARVVAQGRPVLVLPKMEGVLTRSCSHMMDYDMASILAGLDATTKSSNMQRSSAAKATTQQAGPSKGAARQPGANKRKAGSQCCHSSSQHAAQGKLTWMPASGSSSPRPLPRGVERVKDCPLIASQVNKDLPLAVQVVLPEVFDYLDEDPSNAIYLGPNWPSKSHSWHGMSGHNLFQKPNSGTTNLEPVRRGHTRPYGSHM